jgi:NOL1/NOP2/fmu family ribosome biogenesis protein
VTTPGPQNSPPTGSLTATDISPQSIIGPAPRIVQFTASFSDPEGKPVTATLNFGDGESTTLSTSATVVQHNYAVSGNYQPNLVLRDDLPGRSVTLYVNNDLNYRVTVTPPVTRYPLNVALNGQGTVTSTPGGISCPGDCAESYDAATVVTISAAPAPGWAFSGWSGDCAGASTPLPVMMTGAKSCTATFIQLPNSLNVTVNGQGTVASNPLGISCPGDCTEIYLSGTVVTLTATPASGWGLLQWSGDCAGTSPTTQVTIDSSKACTATFIQIAHSLNVGINGQGSVASNPAGIACPGDCTEPYAPGSIVTLTAAPSGGWAFAGWTGDCTGTNLSTQVTMNALRLCTATFTRLPNSLAVTLIGQGTVTSNPAGINCPGDCDQQYPSGTIATLSATPVVGWAFTGWSGDCAGTVSSFPVTMDAAKACTATFTQLSHALNVSVNGQGTVGSSPTGIACPADCTETYLSGTSVTLTAAPSGGWAFSGWSGNCTGTSPTASLTMDAVKSCTATFTQLPNSLSVTVVGQGTVASNPAGINCPGDCGEPYPPGTLVTLTATPSAGWAFSAWSGDCTGTNPTIPVTLNTAKACTATFTQLSYALYVSVNGQGTVGSSPAGINCPGDCAETYLSGTTVGLTATPSAGWQLSQWSGDCSGANPTALVLMNANRACTATFTRIRYPVTVAINGQGSVASNPAGIACPGNCTEPFDAGAVVTLTATPNSGWMFVAWSGDCSGTNPVTQVTANGEKLCTASFTELIYTLNVALNGDGSVEDVPPGGINCPGDCTERYLDGTVVTLNATPSAGWQFSQWSGGCSGPNPTTQVTMNADKTCTAVFAPIIYLLTVNVTGQGTVTSNPAGIACQGDCSEGYASFTVVTLTAVPDFGWFFGGWGGDCGGLNPDAFVLMDGPKNCTAAFTLTPPSGTVYKEDFEVDEGGWTHGDYPPGGQNDTWHRDNQTCAGTSLGSFAFGSNGNFGPACSDNSSRERSFALSPDIDLPPASTLTLTLDAWSQDENGPCLNGVGYDKKDVGITTDGGNTYTLLNDCWALVDTNDVWQSRSFDISSFAGQTVQVIFVYETVDEVVQGHFYIDNVEITQG